MRHWLLGFFLAALVVWAGCGKSSTQGPLPLNIQGVKVDSPKLQQEFAGAADPLKALVGEMTAGVRYLQFDRALAALDKLANSPGVTDAQKKLISDVTAQIKQAQAKAGSAPGQ